MTIVKPSGRRLRRVIALLAVVSALSAIIAAAPLTRGFKATARLTLFASDLDLHGNTLFTAGSVLHILDVSDEFHPVQRAFWMPPLYAGGGAFVRVSEPYAYYVTPFAYLSVVYMGSPSNPLSKPYAVANLSLNLAVQDVELWHTTLVLSGRDDGVVPSRGIVAGINVSNPTSPREAFQVYRDSPIMDSAVDGDTLYSARADGLLDAWTLSPTWISVADTSQVAPFPGPWPFSAVSGVGVTDSGIVVGARTVGVVALSREPKVSVVQTTPVAGEARKVAVTGNKVFVATSQGTGAWTIEEYEQGSDGQLSPARSRVLPGAWSAETLAVDPGGSRFFTSSEMDVTIGADAPLSWWEASATVRVGLLLEAALFAVVVFMVWRGIPRRRSSRDERVGGRRPP